MDAKKKKRLNKFAVIIIFIIVIPELTGQLYFETQKHPTSSSVDAALSLTDKQHSMYTADSTRCHLTIQNDTTSSNVSRVAGLQGQYATYSCN